MSVASAAERLYIHETVEITVKKRQQYMEHFLSMGPIARRVYDRLGFKVVKQREAEEDPSGVSINMRLEFS